MNLNENSIRSIITDFKQGTHIALLAEYITNELIVVNSCDYTLNPLTLRLPPTFDAKIYPEIYFVSKRGHEHIYSSTPTSKDVYQWVMKNQQHLCIAGHYVGGWLSPDDGDYYLDLTIAVFGLSYALSLGEVNQQQSIYHPATETTIPVGYIQGLFQERHRND